MLHEVGVEKLSIRKLADVAGVSHSAPYYHFANKQGLLCAIAYRGFEGQLSFQQNLLTQILSIDDKTLAQKALQDFIQQYLQMAIEQPAMYRLMYSRHIWEAGDQTEALKQISYQSYQLWNDVIRHMVALEAFHHADDIQRMAQAIWANLHGLCHFAIDGVYVNPSDIKEMSKTALKMVFA
jgi:AcrR family transcriptional regulator